MKINRLPRIILFTISLCLLAGCGLTQQGRASNTPSPSVIESIPPSPAPTAIASPSAPEVSQPVPTETPAEGNVDKPLTGRIIVLDPGHQSLMKEMKVSIAPGSDETRQDYAIGTRGVATGVFEYEVVLEVAKKLESELIGLGATVILTRDTHEVLLSNIERAQIANEAGADVLVRIHCDGSDNQKVNGISVLYPGSKYIEDEEMLAASLSLSEAMLAKLSEETGAKNRGLSERNDLVGFNYAKVPVTLVEMGFMTNPEEDMKLNDDTYQMKLVKGMVRGLLDYFAAGSTD